MTGCPGSLILPGPENSPSFAIQLPGPPVLHPAYLASQSKQNQTISS